MAAILPALVCRRHINAPRWVALAALLAAVLALAGCGGGGSTSSSSSSATAITAPATPGKLPPHRDTPLLSIFQADTQLHQDPAGTLDIMRSLGADAVRVFMPWGNLGALGQMAPASTSPTMPAGFNGANPADYPNSSWAIYDTIIRDARERGMQVDLTLGPPPPLWARGPSDPGHPDHPQWRPNLTEFTKWVRAVGTRYSGHYHDPTTGSVPPRVDMWAIWNEPNFGPMIAPQTTRRGIDVSPRLYRGMLDGAWTALGDTGHGSDTILIGELAPYGHALGAGPGEFGYMVPLRFLRSLYCVDGSLHPLSGTAATRLGCPASSSGFRAAHPALFDASGLSLHPYAQGPPSVSIPGEPDYANLPALPHVESTLDRIFGAYGASRKIPLYSTEFGVHTNPPEKVFGTVSPSAAAGYMNQAEYLSWRDPRLRSYEQYLLMDGPTGIFATGLEFYGGAPKPGYGAYRMPLYLPVQKFTPGKPLEVWGAARPARYASSGRGSSGRVRIQFRPAGHGAFRTMATVQLAGSVYFDQLIRFPGPGAVRTAWPAPDGTTLLSRIAVITRH